MPGQLADELVVDAALGDHPGGRGADLAGVEASTRWRWPPTAVSRSASSNTTAGALAAQLEQQALHVAAGDLGDAQPDARSSR